MIEVGMTPDMTSVTRTEGMTGPSHAILIVHVTIMARNVGDPFLQNVRAEISGAMNHKVCLTSLAMAKCLNNNKKLKIMDADQDAEVMVVAAVIAVGAAAERIFGTPLSQIYLLCPRQHHSRKALETLSHIR
jgi:hypothetical protein